MDPATLTPPQRLTTYTPQSDPSKYIRTYAKDLAAAGGANPATVSETPIEAAAPISAPSRHGLRENIDDITLPEVDMSPVDHSDDPSSAKEFPQEIIDLKESDSEGIFKNPFRHKASAEIQTPEPMLAPEPTASPAPIQDMFSMSRTTPTVFTLPSTVPPLEAEEPAVARETILSRLRARIMEKPPEEILDIPVASMDPSEPPPVPPIAIETPSVPALSAIQTEPIPDNPAVPIELVEAPIAPAVSVQPALAESRPPIELPHDPVVVESPPFELPPAPANIAAEPTPPAAVDFSAFAPINPARNSYESSATESPLSSLPSLSRNDGTPSPLHTYSSDFADRIDQKQSSTFSVLAAQSDAGQTARSAPTKRRSYGPLFAGLAMLVVGVGALAGAYIYTKNQSTVPAVSKVPSAITFDESVEVQGTGQDLMKAVSDVANDGNIFGNVIVTYVTATTSASAGQKIPQPGEVLIDRLNLNAPSILLRNIQDVSTVGVIKADAESRPFMILKVNSYERTFAGMLAWEDTMRDDLAIWYPTGALPAATSTASSTLPVAPAPAGFTDAIVSNHDVRIARDVSGSMLFLYGYIDKNTLIIARDEAAFTALSTRLSAAED